MSWRSGAHTIVDVFPDNIVIPNVGVALPKLAIYLRVMLDPTSEPGMIAVSLNFPNGETKEIVRIDADTTQRACKEARDSGAPYAGIMSKVIMLQFAIIQVGRITVVAKMEGREQICAAVNFQLPPTSSIAPEQPSPQSVDAPGP